MIGILRLARLSAKIDKLVVSSRGHCYPTTAISSVWTYGRHQLHHVVAERHGR